MIVESTALPDVVIVRSPVYRDDRGMFTEVFHHTKFAELGLPTTFLQDNHSNSTQHTLRGLHFQTGTPQGKLVRAVRGEIFDVAVDMRSSSPTLGRWFGTILSEGDGRQLWIPAGFAHGFVVLSPSADVTYKCTTIYDSKTEVTVRWDDRTLGIEWPLPSGIRPLLSERDASAGAFADAPRLV